MANDSNTNYGRIPPLPHSPPPYIPPPPVPVLVNNPYNFLEANQIHGPNHLGNGGNVDEWNMIMQELEKIDHPRIQEVYHSRRGGDAISLARSILYWLRTGGDNVVCTKCQAKSDRFTNYVTDNGRPIDMAHTDYWRKRLICKECYEKQKLEYENHRIMREKEFQKKKEEEEERNKCSCTPPLLRCQNCIRKNCELYKNDPRPACQKCGSKNNTSMLKFGNHYHRTCDDCIQYFEKDNSS
jgi:hypothetical protein